MSASMWSLAAGKVALPSALVDDLRGNGRADASALACAAMTDVTAPPGIGPLLRDWRQRRRLSQLDLALEAGVSARHPSFVETGRSRPSPQMVLHLAEQLDVPLRDRNHMLLAAGYAPAYNERPLDAPELEPVRAALDLVLAGHEPYPALVVDRGWDIVAANSAVNVLTEGVAPELLGPPANAMRLALHPDGLAPRIANLGEWRAPPPPRRGPPAAPRGGQVLAARVADVGPCPRAPPAPAAPTGARAVSL